jgi:hypothetical protein
MVNDKAIEPHVPVWEKGERTDGTFSRSDFDFDEEADHYTCPNEKQLKRHRRPFKQPRSGISKDNTIRYRAKQRECEACPYKENCCPNTTRRTVSRSVYESARDVARAVAKTEDYHRSRRQRKKAEMLFAHMKRVLKVDRLRLRGLSGAQDEFVLTATAQNLRPMANYLGTGPPVALGMA